MNTPARLLTAIALSALISSCATPPQVSNNVPQQTAPDRAVVSNATDVGLFELPPPKPALPPPAPAPAPVRRPNPNFNATAFESGGSAPGIRAQYEAAAAAYRQSAAQSGSPEREQYLEAARKLDQQAAALGN